MPRLLEVPATVFSFILVAAHCNITRVNKFFLFIFLMNILKASQQDVYPHRNIVARRFFYLFFYLPLVITSGCFMHPRVYIIIYAQNKKRYLPHPFHPCIEYKYIYIWFILFCFRFGAFTRRKTSTA